MAFRRKLPERPYLIYAWSSASWCVSRLWNLQGRLLIQRQAHGYATAEFEVTEERLGVYLPVGAQALCLVCTN